jgi:hypothetical protein
MNRHLNDDERLAAADGSLERERLAHLDACHTCRERVNEARAFLAEIAASDVPEPSPLFWDHFSERVRDATRDQGRQAPAVAWRAWVSLVAAAASVVLAVWLVRQPHMLQAPPDTSQVAEIDGSDDVAWESVVELASAVGDDDWFAVSDELVSFDELTPAEREAFVRLLRHELEISQ